MRSFVSEEASYERVEVFAFKVQILAQKSFFCPRRAVLARKGNFRPFLPRVCHFFAKASLQKFFMTLVRQIYSVCKAQTKTLDLSGVIKICGHLFSVNLWTIIDFSKATNQDLHRGAGIL